MLSFVCTLISLTWRTFWSFANDSRNINGTKHKTESRIEHDKGRVLIYLLFIEWQTQAAKYFQNIVLFLELNTRTFTVKINCTFLQSIIIKNKYKIGSLF